MEKNLSDGPINDTIPANKDNRHRLLWGLLGAVFLLGIILSLVQWLWVLQNQLPSSPLVEEVVLPEDTSYQDALILEQIERLAATSTEGVTPLTDEEILAQIEMLAATNTAGVVPLTDEEILKQIEALAADTENPARANTIPPPAPQP